MNDMLIARAASLLEQEFGPDWQTIAGMLGTEGLRKRVGKELTSFMAFPERGTGGDNHWRGNCSSEVIAAVLRYVRTVSTTMERTPASLPYWTP